MPKYAMYRAAPLLVISSAVSISYTQDTTTTPEPSAAEMAAPAMATQRTWLGVSVSEADGGVTIARISPNSPAETAELADGDVILAVNGTSITSASDLQAIIESAADGDVVSLTIERESEQISVDVTLTTRMGRGGFAPGFVPMSDLLQVAEFALDTELEAVDGGYQVV